jgi:hypothetical protein
VCILSPEAGDVNPAIPRPSPREAVTYSEWSHSADGSDADVTGEHWTRPGEALARHLAEHAPPWIRWRAWWPGTGLPSRDDQAELDVECSIAHDAQRSGESAPVELTQAQSSRLPADRRRAPRLPGLSLSERERERLRSQLATVAGCGRSHAAYRRCLPGESACTLERLVAQRWCGTRQCPDCDAQRRERSASRVSGPWRTLLTLGLPSRDVTIRQAWSGIHRWISRLMRSVRRAASFEGGGPVRVSVDRADYCHALKIAAGKRRELLSTVDYAWAIEPHKSGYPHVHIATTADWIDRAWLISAWREATGASVRCGRAERVRDASETCHYLAKYVSKTSLPMDILAVLYRRRLWACTLPVWEEDASWSPEPPHEDASPWRSVRDPLAWGAAHGWTLESSAPGRYAAWRREVSWEHVSQRLPEQLSDDELGTLLWIRALLPGYARGVPYDRDPYVERVRSLSRKKDEKQLASYATVV